MPPLELSFSDFERVYADLPAAALKNRFFEENPFQGTKKAAIARPPTETLGNYGNGPIRKIYSQPGIFSGAAFFVSDDTLYRRDTDGTTYAVTGTIYGSGEVSMCSAKGLDYERIFIADGNRLQFYSGGTNATGEIEATGGTTAAAGDTLRIGDTYWEFETPASNNTVTDGTGSVANPFKVAIEATWALTFANLVAAISFTGVSGEDYSGTLAGQSSTVSAALSSSGSIVTITSKADNAAGNLIELEDTVDGGGNIATPVGGFLTGGNLHGLSGVEVPDGLPPTQVATLKSYILVAIGSTDRFYFIEPAGVTIDPLNFATAEAVPDEIVALVAMQDTAWFIGQSSTEIWYPTGNQDTPFAPVAGRVYDRGALEGTVVNIKGTLYLVDQDYIVYGIGGGPQRVSNHGVEELIRTTIASES